MLSMTKPTLVLWAAREYSFVFPLNPLPLSLRDFDSFQYKAVALLVHKMLWQRQGEWPYQFSSAVLFETQKTWQAHAPSYM